MPQLIALALVGAGLYAGYKWLSGKARRAVAEAERRAAEAAGAPRDLGVLEWDAAAGVYRPRNRLS
jgi:hypothetical protein